MMISKKYDKQFKTRLKEEALESALFAEVHFGGSGWFREFSDFFETFMGYGEL